MNAIIYFTKSWEAPRRPRAVEMAHQLQPDVVIMDVTMPEMNGIDATEAIHRELPSVQIIWLSMQQREDLERAMREAGAVIICRKTHR